MSRHKLIPVLPLLVVLAAAVSPPSSTPPAEAELQLFLLIGQSNMAGRGKIESEDLAAHPRVWKLTQNETWAPGIDPLHYDKPKIAGVGLGTSFAKAIAGARPGVHIGLIPCAVGGTSIDKWNRGGKLYEQSLHRTRIAMKHGKLAGVLWHQGESDCGSEHQRAAYPAKLERLIADLRTDLESPELPFILGQLGPFHETKSPGSAAMSRMLLEFPKTHPHTACAVAAGLTDSGDRTHFDAKSLREFGKRYAEVYLRMER